MSFCLFLCGIQFLNDLFIVGMVGLGPWHLLWAGGRCLFGPVFWGTPCRETGLFLLGWHGPREHEGVWLVPRLPVCSCPLFPFVCLLTSRAFFLLSSRNCGSARSRHIWPSVQSVEKQRVRVPKLQKIDSSLSLRPALGEMPRHGTQQQSHCQPQVGQWRAFRTDCCTDLKWVWTSHQVFSPLLLCFFFTF